MTTTAGESGVIHEPAVTRKVSAFYQPELDGLRFIAFLGVFFFHSIPRTPESYPALGKLAPWLVAALSSGAFGVDLFFALSAYLITNLLLREKELRGSLDVKSFYIRRILRIWPLYFAFLGFSALLGHIVPRQHLDLPYVAGFLLLSGNWIYVWLGYTQSIALPLWSVSIEEQFYLLWPLVVRRMSRTAMVQLACFLLIVGNVSRIWLASAGVSEHVVEYNTLARIDPIALGILFALLVPAVPKFHAGQRIALWLAGSAIWIGAAMYCGFNSEAAHVPFTGTVLGRPLVAIASLLILISAIGCRALGNKVFAYLGKISYGLYVIHCFSCDVVFHFFKGSAAIRPILALLLTIVLAAASYRWLETPFLDLKKRFTYVKSRPV